MDECVNFTEIDALGLRDRNEHEWQFCKLSNGAVQWIAIKDGNWP